MNWYTVIFSTLVFILGTYIGSNYVQGKWDTEKIGQLQVIEEYRDHIKLLETSHQVRESAILKEFGEIKRDYENSVRDINDIYTGSLLKQKERSDHYREKYHQCADNELIERTILLDKYLQEGTILVEELETIIRFKESGIIARDKIIENDRLLINSK